MRPSLFIFAFVFFALIACKSTPKPEPVQAPAESSDLSRAEAESRKARLSELHYKVSFHIDGAEPAFVGDSRIEFELKDNTQPLRLDFYEGELRSAKINGQAFGSEIKKKYAIELPASALKNGANVVELSFKHDYSNDGRGLHRFIDPETKQAFMYTDLEAFDANRLMPCFDQPDLRSMYTFTVIAPTGWQVISTTRETSVKASAGGTSIWTFPTSPRIATYLISLHAGPYKVWNDEFEGMPIRLFARPSLARYVNHAEWLKITKQGLAFFNSYFGLKYPFKKYDQLFVPEFNSGAMENVAAVTFSERMIQRSAETREDRRDKYNVLLHEMAHMWFGDVVTMKWWNDLWLNESFAEYMAAHALFEATEFKESWQEFYTHSKRKAYWEDGLVTTHPIEATIPSVKFAFSNFDGITYEKGASTLKQLRAYVGKENFDKGIKDYIRKHAFQNTELKDFVASIQANTTLDLNAWSERWLRQVGADKIEAVWTCEGGLLKKIELVSTPKMPAKFRPQTLQVGLFNEGPNGLALTKSERVVLNQPRQTLEGSWPCPQAVYPNYGDDAYAQVKLDPVTLEYAKANVGKVPDLLLRTMLWDNLWQMVRDTEMPLKAYADILIQHFPSENDPLIVSQIANTIYGERGGVFYYWPQNTEASRAQRLDFIGKMEDLYLARILKAKAGSDGQRLWFDNYVTIATTPKAADQMAKWMDQPEIAPGFKLDVDRKWELVRQLVRYNHPSAKAQMAAMKRADSSDRAKRYLLASDAVTNDAKVKRKWVDQLRQPKTEMSMAEMRAVMRSLFPVEQENLAAAFENDFYSYLKTEGRNEDEFLVSRVAFTMVPLRCEPTVHTRMQDFVGQNQFGPTLTRELRVSLQEDERCQKIRAASQL